MRNNVEFTDNIPEDILLQIFYRLPAKSLGRFSCVSKLWYNLIDNDKQQFNKFHMIESQKRPVLIFTFTDSLRKKRFYYLKKETHGNYILLSFEDKKRNQDVFRGAECTVGYDNGLSCYERSVEHHNNEWIYFSLTIRNHSRVEKLIIVSRFRLRSSSQREHRISGFLFGCDLLNNEYKVMCIIKYKDEYEYYIITLGSTDPWRKISNPWSKQRPRQDDFRSTKRRVPLQISCNGTLFYETYKDEAEKEFYKRLSLVSFDLHGEKFQIIKLPADDEFVSNYNMGGFVMMEYKGCFCYSNIERIDPHSGKVVLHILKDTVKHFWVKETIQFDLPKELDNPAPPGSTHIVNFFNQIILHWSSYSKRQRNHVMIQLYNVHSKELKKVKYVNNEDLYHRQDHHISSQVESFLSLKSFATTTGKANTKELLKNFIWSSSCIATLFNDVPTSNPSIISFLYPL